MLRKLLNRLRIPATAPLPADAAARVIHIHEDDWGMRNLYPESAFVHAAAEIADAKTFSEAHFDGFGWSEMRAIQPPPTSFREAGVTVAGLVATLDPILPRIRRFNATISSMIDSDERDPYGSYEEDAVCFGFHRDCFIKIDPADETLVGAVWHQVDCEPGPEFEALKQGLLAINAVTPVIVADYWLNVSGRLSDPAFAEAYFTALAGDPSTESAPAGT